MDSNPVVTAESCYGTKNKHENTQNNVIEGDIKRETTVDTDQKYQEKVEASTNMLCKLKKIDHLNRFHNNMDVPDVEEVLHVSSYPLLESMGFDTDISDGVTKMRAATILGDIVRLHKCTKNTLKYIDTS